MTKILLATNDPALIGVWRSASVPPGDMLDFATSAGELLGRAAAGQPSVIVLAPLELDTAVVIEQLRHHAKTALVPVLSVSPAECADVPGVLARIAALVAPKRILIADDDRQMAAVLEAVLTRRGFRVALAYDGAETLRRIKEDPPDLILLDIMLPVMDGFHVCQALNEDHTLKYRPRILIISGRNSDWDQNLGSACGADGYLVKPFTHQALLEAVDGILVRQQ